MVTIVSTGALSLKGYIKIQILYNEKIVFGKLLILFLKIVPVPMSRTCLPYPSLYSSYLSLRPCKVSYGYSICAWNLPNNFLNMYRFTVIFCSITLPDCHFHFISLFLYLMLTSDSPSCSGNIFSPFHVVCETWNA